ncbi:hypothetical protein [Rheinheimera sp. WS51]|uniref:hypothetical protein n=1 Tax=Rheinheimera sp. WS51 TaxID=3425886 RepID=UPI003D94F4D8
MKNVVSLLEYVASNANLQNASEEQLQQLFLAQGSDSEILAALQQNKVHELETALDARTGLICGVMPAEEPQKQPDDEPAPQEEPEEPEDSSASLHNEIEAFRLIG